MTKRVRCPSCRKKQQLSEATKFCEDCGMALGHVERVCPSCDELNRWTADQCKSCRSPLDAAEADYVTMRWDLAAGEVGRRLRETRVDRALQGELAVGPNAQALLYHDGALVEELAPGRNRIGRDAEAVLLGQKVVREVEVVLTNAADLPLTFTGCEARSKEALLVRADLEIVVRIREPKLLVGRLFSSASSLTISELATTLLPELLDVLHEALGEISWREAPSDAALRADVEHRVRERFAASLDRWGLELVRVRVAQFHQDSIERWLGAKAAAEMAGLQSEQNQLEFAASRRKLDDTAQELELLDREWQLLIKKEKGHAEVLDTLENLEATRELDKAKSRLLGQEAFEELRREIEQRKEDADFGRQMTLLAIKAEKKHALERMRVEYEQELASMQRSYRHEEQTDEQKFGHARERDELVQEAHRKDWARQQTRIDAQLDAEKFDHNIELKTKLLDFRGKDLVVRGQEAEHALHLEREEQKIEQTGLDAESNRKLREIEAKQKAVIELEKQRAEGDARRAESLRGLSDEQSIAFISRDNPRLADALKAKFERGRDSGDERALREAHDEVRHAMEQMMARADKSEQRWADLAQSMVQQKAGSGRSASDNELDRMERFAGDAMEKMSRFSGVKGDSGSRQAPRAPQAPQGASSRFCGGCGKDVDASAKFCTHCGEKL